MVVVLENCVFWLKILLILNQFPEKSIERPPLNDFHVADHSSKNKMTVENLATIFSPTLFCSGSIPAMPNHQLLHFLINNPRVVPKHR
ncbi:hypothetical protein CRE_13739 [Caenorhabditis remanei]|uniref:Rho-GAP domain-containing protein n=1 Tax=Caenorhabditis remanei TaxID=31234 RepID=E3NEW9_CAERE|nr:hypothetical protein CRE_13739 [Caenorhabditis remanei]